MTKSTDETTSFEATAEFGSGRALGVRLGRLLIGALGAVLIQAAPAVLPGIGSAAFAAVGDSGVPSIALEPVHCDAYQMNAYTPIIQAYDATPGIVDSQYVDFQLQLEVLSGSTWQPVSNIKSYVSGYFVVNDGTGIVKDVTVPNLHGFLVPGTGIYRVDTLVWWTSAGTWFGPKAQPGPHFRATDAAYLPVAEGPNGQSCAYQGDEDGNPLWIADKNGPTIWPGSVYCDGNQVHVYEPTIVANDATGSVDYQQVVFGLELEQLSTADNSWHPVANASYVSGRFVVNDGTGIVKDVTLPGYHTFNMPDPELRPTLTVPNPDTTVKYRIQTTAWWTGTATSPTFGSSVTWSVSQKPGAHYVNTGLMYIYSGHNCSYQPLLAVTIKS